MSYKSRNYILFLALNIFVLLLCIIQYKYSEPFYNNDETRHVMTGVYFNDLLHNFPVNDLRAYTERYYLKYPSLGLLVWPPFFYIFEGIFMFIFGTNIIVSKIVIHLFTLMACSYMYLIVKMKQDEYKAFLSGVILAVTPMVSEYSRYVMLEVPTLALCLASIFYFMKYIEMNKKQYVYISAFFASLAALTRFDAIFLFIAYVIMLVKDKNMEGFKKKEIYIASALAIIIVLPYYYISYREISWVLNSNISNTYNSKYPDFLSLKRLFYYPSCLLKQIGWLGLMLSIAGFVFCLREKTYNYCGDFLALIISVYLTFTFMAEMEERHVIYWVPGFVFFTMTGVVSIANLIPRKGIRNGFIILLVVGLIIVGTNKKIYYITGYAEAAKYVLDNNKKSKYCIFNGTLDGNFIYQIRNEDPNNRLWILRADKIFYSYFLYPNNMYKEFTDTEEEMKQMIYEYSPEFIIYESLEKEIIPPADVILKNLLQNHPDRYSLVKTIIINSNYPRYLNSKIYIYKNIINNPEPRKEIDIEIQMLNKNIRTISK